MHIYIYIYHDDIYHASLYIVKHREWIPFLFATKNFDPNENSRKEIFERTYHLSDSLFIYLAINHASLVLSFFIWIMNWFSFYLLLENKNINLTKQYIFYTGTRECPVDVNKSWLNEMERVKGGFHCFLWSMWISREDFENMILHHVRFRTNRSRKLFTFWEKCCQKRQAFGYENVDGASSFQNIQSVWRSGE